MNPLPQTDLSSSQKIAVVIPCYRVTKHILDVLSRMGNNVDRIYVVDDCCPDNSGQLVEEKCSDVRVSVIYHPENKGVGGATITGYRAALQDDMDIVVKVDGDGQMDPKYISILVKPIIKGQADYTKGNRFFSYEHVGDMPLMRLLGNGVLSFFSKVSSGYWNIVDPNNGYTAIHKTALRLLPLDKISNDYFFESDMLFRLNSMRAVVVDIPMKSIYEDEESNLRSHRVIFPFLAGHCKNFFKRIAYNYFIRDISFATLELIFGTIFLAFGSIYGGLNWIQHISTDTYAPGGVVMLAAITVIIGLQLMLSAINYDIQNVPKMPLQLLQDDTWRLD
jgi:dolichol-phosphate mannosyltransferase